jgi:membrane-associated phospholipid phosphatase
MDTVRALHASLDRSESFWLAVTMLGRDEVFIVVLALYSWLVNPAGMRRLGVTFSLSYLTNTALKYGLNLPRPFAADPELASAAAKATAGGPGLPSGHAQLSATLWLGMVWQLSTIRQSAPASATVKPNARWFVFLALVLVALISLSRLVLGVHYPSDVLAGLILGVLFATLSLDSVVGLIGIPAFFFFFGFSTVFPPDRYEYPKYSLSGKFFISLVVYIISYYMIGFVLRLLNLEPGRSTYWTNNLQIIVTALLVANLIPNTIPRELTAGLGLLTGFALLEYKFSPPTTWAARIGVAVIGLAMVFAVYFGLSALLPLGLRESSVGRVIRYALLVLMAGEGVPRVLRRWMPETGQGELIRLPASVS